MPPTRSLPPPVYVSTELANIPFRFRRKSLSEDDLPNPDYYLVPPSPSLSPSRSFSMSSSPPSSPTALNTSPTGPPHLDTAKIHPASSPAHPTTYHGYGYAYTYSRGLSHFASSHHDISSAPPKFVPPNSRSHPHPIISPPTTNPTRSTFSPTPADAHGLRPSFASLLRKGAVHDEDEDDIEDYGFALDLDDILTGSSPTRRISFTTSSERDRPFMRSPVKPRLPRSRALPNDTATRPFPTSSATTSSIPVELTLRPREAQCDSTRTSAAPADIPLPLAAPVTPIRARSDPRHVAPPFPSMGGTADADLDDTLPPSSPIVSPLSSPLSTPSTSRPSDSGCGSDSSHTVRRATPPGEDRQQLHSDLTLPPSSPNPVPYTPARSSDTKREDDGMDMEMDLDLADLVASPPSPTLDALRITSRVAVRALLNPAPPPVSAPLPVPESIPDFVDDVLPQLEMPNEGEIEVEAETKVEGAEEKMVSILDGDVTPLLLPEASEEVVVDLGGPDVDGDVSEEVMATEIRVQIPEPEPEPCPVPTAQTKSRRSSCAPSRAHTPHVAQIQSQETPSSPLSPTPSSIADADVDADIDFEMGCDAELPAPALPAPVSMPVAGPSRSRLSSRASSPTPPPKVKVPDTDAAEPPRKKMRREEDADVSHAKAKPKVTAKRPRTPTFADSESEREAEKAVLKPRKKSAAKANRQVDPATTTKLVRKKRSRAVLSDDETESDSPSAPIRAPALPAPSLTVNKKKDGDREARERKKEKPKKARAKDAQADLELENEPLHHHHHHPHLHAATSNLHPKPAKSSSLSAAPPKSATNIARPELPSPSALDAPRISVSKPPRLAHASADATKPSATATAPATGKSKAAARSSRPDAEEIEIGAEADALVAAFDLPLPAPELEGMLIETLATARASSLATSALYGALMAARPALREMRLPALKEEGKVEEEEDDAAEAKDADAKSKRRAADAASRRAWVPALEAVLEAGWRRSGVFGKIVNSGTDLANHALRLEARWFYDPDQDADADRAALVRTMMRRPGKRSETMKAKHYYWRPLPKISRWDDEDEL